MIGIVLIAADGSAITQIAENEDSKYYDKMYFTKSQTDSGVLVNPRRTKRVNFPVNVDGRYYSDAGSLFKYLKARKNYSNLF